MAIRTGPLKRDYESASRRKCSKCQNAECPIFPLIPRADPRLDIFLENDRDRFLKRVREAAVKMRGPFWWSELRETVGIRPLVPNWWGASTKVLEANGFQVVDGHRASTHGSRNGAQDRRWCHRVYLHRVEP